MTRRRVGEAIVAATVALLAVACGGGGGGHGVDGNVEPGFFIGHTSTGGNLSIAADSIRAIFFQCGAHDPLVVFVPPEPIATDGSFAIDFNDAGRHFTVTGLFTSQNHVDGRIDGDFDCDGDFEADRCNPRHQACVDSDNDGIPDEIDPEPNGPPRTPTPIPTSTPQVTATVELPTASATPSRTSTPTARPTSTGLCGNGMVDVDDNEPCDPTATFRPIDPDICGDPDFRCVCDTFCQDGDFTTAVTCNNRCELDFSHCADRSLCSF